MSITTSGKKSPGITMRHPMYSFIQKIKDLPTRLWIGGISITSLLMKFRKRIRTTIAQGIKNLWRKRGWSSNILWTNSPRAPTITMQSLLSSMSIKQLPYSTIYSNLDQLPYRLISPRQASTHHSDPFLKKRKSMIDFRSISFLVLLTAIHLLSQLWLNWLTTNFLSLLVLMFSLKSRSKLWNRSMGISYRVALIWIH